MRCLLLALSLTIAAQAVGDSQRLPGKFVWTELVTYDVAMSETFYGQLFGWQFDEEGDYRVAWLGEEAVGGLIYRARVNPEGKSRWIAYVSVEDMGAVKTALQEAGAEILADSRQVAGLGELVVFADGEGAVFGVIDTAVSDPGDYLADIGDWIWIQLFSRDADRASRFYELVGGYQRVEVAQSLGTWLLVREGYARAVVSTIAAQHRDASPAWVPFVRIADMRATLDRVHALGGRTLVAPRADLYDNRVALIEAPDGSAVGVLVWTAADDEEAAR